MLAEAPNNKGKPKKDWKPPPGYKSALGKARDAARAKEAKTRGTVASMIEPDTASEDDDGEYSQVGRSFRIAALRPDFQSPKPENENRFNCLDGAEQQYDPDTIAALSKWAHNVKLTSRNPKKNKKATGRIPGSSQASSSMPHCPAPPPGKGCEVKDDPIIIKSSNDLIKYGHLISSALPMERKALAKIAKKIIGLDAKCGPGEILAMIDTGSFTHALDAEEVLPNHPILPVSKSEQRTAETACGGTLSVLGKVNTVGTVGDVQVGVTWSHMKVKCPRLSVRCLVDDGHDMWVRKGGGVIRHTATGKEL